MQGSGLASCCIFASGLAEAVGLRWLRDCAVPSVSSDSFVLLLLAPSPKERGCSLQEALEGSLEKAVSVQ